MKAGIKLFAFVFVLAFNVACAPTPLPPEGEPAPDATSTFVRFYKRGVRSE